MMEYVRKFQNKAGAIVGSHQPNRPALILYFGDIAMRGRAALHEKLLSQIPENYHAAIVEGAFCSKAEAGSVPCMDISFVTAPMDFGNYAQNWCTPDNLSAARDLLKELLQKTTEKPIAVTMSALDVYLVVGNDGGACELWPAILNIMSDPALTVVSVKWHLVWMFREMAAYQQPRDLSMYRLIKAMENKKLTQNDVAAIPEVQAIPCALEAWEKDLSLVIVSDRNQTGVCSGDVWTASCEAVAGCILAHMFNKNALPECCTCAMYDAIYPDVFWSTGFQLSAMLKLEEELEKRRNARMIIFQPMLSKAWGISSLKYESIVPLLSGVLPMPEDLYLLPVNPGVSAKDLKTCLKLSDSIRLLYGTRYETFFTDALESEPFSERIDQLVHQLEETVNLFARTNGAYAAAALLDAYQPDSLPALFQSTAFEAKQDSVVIGKVGFMSDAYKQRQQEVVLKSADKFTELHSKAVALLYDRLKDAMKQWHARYVQQTNALQIAFEAAAKQFSAVFSGATLSYHNTVKTYADNKLLYTANFTDADFELLESLFTVHDPVNSLLKVLTQLNLRSNSFITLTMQEAFNQLGYINGASDLKTALDKFCKAAVFSPVKYEEKNVYILPASGDWSNGGRVYGLIRCYSTVKEAPATLLESISYLSSISGPVGLQLAQGSALPSENQNADEQPARETRTAAPQQELPEEEQPLGKVQYNKPDSLLTFEWPRHGVELINMTVKSSTNFGQTPYEQTVTVSSKNYLKLGGTLLSNVRLTGRCDVFFNWYEYGQSFDSQGFLTVEPVHISRIITEKGKDFVVQITASESVPMLERYLLLRVRKGNGASITYRLPPLVNGQFTISRQHCHGMPEVVLSDPKWNEYFSF